MLCFKDVGFKFEPHICNKCHDVLMTAYELKNIAILNVKGVDFKCILWGISRDEDVNRLNYPVLEDKGVLWMDSGASKMPVKVIKKMQLEERRFISKLVKMIKETDSKFNDY